MTTAQAAKLIGRTGALLLERGFEITVTILDVRERYGNTDYRVTPIAGAGEKWVVSERVHLGAHLDDPEEGRPDHPYSRNPSTSIVRGD